MSRLSVFAVVALLAGCSAEKPEQPKSKENSAIPANRAPAPSSASDAPVTPPEPGTSGGLTDDRTPLNEGRLDLKGPDGAGQVVQQFAALFEQRRFADARELWGENGVAEDSAAFVSQLESYREVHAQIGAPSEAEGAAGSLYVTVPLVFYGRRASGEAFRLSANATLRRVNDVPGSTALQRQWHLEGLAPA